MARYICSKCGKQLQGDYPVCPYCKSPRATQTPWNTQEPTAQGTPKKSVLLLISSILGVLYAIYSVFYWASANSGNADTIAAIGAGIATVLVMPHMICAVLAAIFNVLGWAMNSRGFALTGAILYAVAAVLFPIYAMFVLVQMILSFVGFARLKTR